MNVPGWVIDGTFASSVTVNVADLPGASVLSAGETDNHGMVTVSPHWS